MHTIKINPEGALMVKYVYKGKKCVKNKKNIFMTKLKELQP